VRFLSGRVKKAYRTSHALPAREAYAHAFDEADRALANRRYFLGDKLSRVDVTLAALLAPLVQPKEHPFEWPAERHPKLDELALAYRGRPAWEHAVRIYREHRAGR